MTEEAYRGAEAVNISTLKEILRSPLHYRYALEHPPEPTPALVFGAALHKYVLQPDEFFDVYAVAPHCDRRTKEGKATWADFLATSEGRAAITMEDMEKIQAMDEALRGNEFARTLLAGQKEVPLFWSDDATGMACKGRLDMYIDTPLNAVCDYKSCNSAATDDFVRAVIKYGYDAQAAHYLTGARKVLCKEYVYLFVAQEKEPPYAVNVIKLDEPLIERGHVLLRSMLDTLHYCRQTGNWYGYEGPNNSINTALLPAWAAEPLD